MRAILPMRSLPSLPSLPSILVALILPAAACGGGGNAPSSSSSTSSTSTGSSSSTGSGGAGGTGGEGGSAGQGGGGGSGGAGGCPRLPAAADRDRRVVVSHPYDADSNPAEVYEILKLSQGGVLSATGKSVSLGRSTWGTVSFTPDGEIGLVAQDDGSLGVLRFTPAGEAEVVHAAFEGSFYASSVVVEPGGSTAIVLDEDWPDSGGGLYRVAIGCDGTLSDLGRIAPTKNIGGLAFLAGGARAVVAARQAFDSTPGHDAELLTWGETPTLLGDADAFGDDEAILSALAVTHDGAFALIGDNSEFSGLPNRVAVVSVGGSTPGAVSVLSPIDDPVAIVASPFDDAALVVSGYGNAFYRVLYAKDQPGPPFTVAGKLSYVGAKPQLPAGAVLIDRGTLKGLVLVAENVGVRLVRFKGGGEIEDLGLVVKGDGLQAITGAIGVQP